jgi:RNA polymerase sigma factor (sigma-70 family)
MNHSSLAPVLHYLHTHIGRSDVAATSDERLLERFAIQGDESAFEAIVERHGPLVWGVCRRVLNRDQDIEDAFQATFLVLVRKAHSIRRRASVSSWLHGVAHRVALQARASVEQNRTHNLQGPSPTLTDAASEASYRELRAILDEEILGLPERFRTPLLLCCLEGRTKAEAARELGWKEGTVASRLARARLRLHGRLTQRGILLAAGPAGMVLVEKSSAAVSAALVAAAVRMAILFAAGEVASAGGVSTSVPVLAKGILNGMVVSKVKVSAALILTVCFLAAGAGWAAHQALQEKPKPEQRKDEPQPTAKKADEDKQAKKDLYGDPLPDGAIARMGSIQLRHAGLSDFVFVDDGKTVLSAGADRVLRFWDVAKGKLARVVKLTGESGPGRAVTLSPDGKLLAAVDQDKLIVWDVETGKEINKIANPNKDVAGLFFSPDGKSLAALAWRPEVVLWDLVTGKDRRIALAPRKIGLDSTFHASFSPDGKVLVAGGGSGEALCVYEVATGREMQRFDCNASTSIISPDSKVLAVASMQNDQKQRDTVLRFFDLSNGKEVAQFPMGQEDAFFTLAFAPDGKTLACGFSDKSCLVDCATGKVLHRLSGRPIGVAIAPDGKTLVASAGGYLRFWDVETGKERHVRPGDFGSSLALAVSPDGKLLAEADWMDQAVSVWDTSTGKLFCQLPVKGTGRYVRNLAFSVDGKTLFGGQFQGFLQFWNVADGKEQTSAQLTDPAQVRKDSVYYTRLQLSSDGKHVSTFERVFASKERTRLARWEIATGKLLDKHLLDEYVRGGPFSPDGTTVAVALANGLLIMDVKEGVLRFRTDGVSQGASVAASPDYRILAAPRKTESKDALGTVGVWETATGKEVATVTTGAVSELVLAPDNRTLVTVDKGFLHAWDLATGNERRRWPLPEAITDHGGTAIHGLILSPDGRRAFTALGDGTCLVWDLTPVLQPGAPLVKNPNESDLATWWDDLASKEGNRVYSSIWRLSEAGDLSVAFLREQVLKAKDDDTEKVRRLIKDLDSDIFEVREKAAKQLAEAGELVAPALRKALEKDPSAEARRHIEDLLSKFSGPIPSSRVLQRLRAIQVLERIGTKEACEVLKKISTGAEAAQEKREARGALARLSQINASDR